MAGLEGSDHGLNDSHLTTGTGVPLMEALRAFRMADTTALSDEKALRWLHGGSPDSFESMQAVARRGDPLEDCYLVVAGCLAVGPLREGESFCDVPYPAGFLFSRWQVRGLNRQPNTILGYGHVTAICPTTVWRVPLRHHEAMVRDPEVFRHFVSRLEGELALVKNLLSIHVSRDTETRVALYLDLLASTTGRKVEGAVEVPLPREGFRQLVSLSRETLNVILGKWRKEKLVESYPGKIYILDVPAFHRRCGYVGPSPEGGG